MDRKDREYLVRLLSTVPAYIFSMMHVAGFGLGALNDADEDDLDVYDTSANARSSRRVAYDATEDDDKVTVGSSRDARHKPSQSVCRHAQ